MIERILVWGLVIGPPVLLTCVLVSALYKYTTGK